ncbi:hypothetical protein LX70_02976 [Defluviimonas denitrificans]|jgi:hypothetical protein|uniref:Lipoprotein n=1 Tax=Albidovulum denitrificans TaxID=404881 RepID=A0A2S8S5J8_9RHOB|nr:hypothetical protein LX70_02976 [Defluviimonas denitrificans]
MKSIYYITMLIGFSSLIALAACDTPSLRTNCWAKVPEVSRGYSGGMC